MSRIPQAVLDAVDERRDGSCEATGCPTLNVQYHHRRAYGMGGRQHDDPEQNTVPNILGLCPRHHAWAHAHPNRAKDLGLIVPQWASIRDTLVIPTPSLGPC